MATPEVQFRESLEIDPLDCNAQYYISEILVNKSRIFLKWGDRMDEVLDMLLEARKHAPYRSDVHKVLGDTYFEIEDYDSAMASYREHIRLGGTDTLARERVEAKK